MANQIRRTVITSACSSTTMGKVKTPAETLRYRCANATLLVAIAAVPASPSGGERATGSNAVVIENLAPSGVAYVTHVGRRGLDLPHNAPLDPPLTDRTRRSPAGVVVVDLRESMRGFAPSIYRHGGRAHR